MYLNNTPTLNNSSHYGQIQHDHSSPRFFVKRYKTIVPIEPINVPPTPEQENLGLKTHTYSRACAENAT